MHRTYESFLGSLFNKNSKDIYNDYLYIKELIDKYKDQDVNVDIYDHTSSNNYWVILKYGDANFSVSCLRNDVDIRYKFFIEGEQKRVDIKLVKQLYSILSTLHFSTERFCELISKVIGEKVDQDRIEEFGVVKNNKIDYISLNSLFDFYEKPFDKEKVEEDIKSLKK